VAGAHVDTHHKGQSDNRVIDLPVRPSMTERDVELAALVRVQAMLERDVAPLRSAISARTAAA
jgi:hypothetical protein